MTKAAAETTEGGSTTVAAANTDETSELETLKKECKDMMVLIKQLEKEEKSLTLESQILAREALLCGFQPNALEPPPPKRRRAPAAKKKDTSTTEKAK